MPGADPEPPGRVDDANRAHHVAEVGQRFAHSHEHDVVDFLASLALDRDDLIENFVWLQVSGKSVEAARAKFAAVGASDLGRNANCPPVRTRSVKGGRGRNQNRFYQTFVYQSKKEFACGVMRTEHADDLDLAKGELFCEPGPEVAGEISHVLERLDALLIQPVGNLSRSIARSAQFLDQLFQLIELERLDVRFGVPNHLRIYENRPPSATDRLM